MGEAAEIPGDPPPGDGFTMVDGVALVVGSAVASVHLKGLSEENSGASPTLFWITFVGVSLTATGPFLFLARRFLRRVADYPGLGDLLWAILGIPWAVGALLPIPSAVKGTAGGFEIFAVALYNLAMILGIGGASMVALVVVWRNWIMRPPDLIAARIRPSWTDRIGLVLAIAWPVQCGFGLMILG